MEDRFLTLEWENGDSVECEIIDRFEYEGKTYVVLNSEEDEESYIYILNDIDAERKQDRTNIPDKQNEKGHKSKTSKSW